MTLLVNIAAMTVAFYAVLCLHGRHRHRRPRAGWPAPAIDPRLLIAIVLIFAELMLVTARGAVLLDVLEPAAGDAADARPVGGGPLQRRPAQLRERRRCGGRRRGSREVLYYVLPNLAPFDVKAEVVHGMPVACAARRPHAGVCRGLHRHPADGGDRRFSGGGTSSERCTAHRARRTAGCMPRLPPLLAVSLVACRWCAIAAGQPYEPPERRDVDSIRVRWRSGWRSASTTSWRTSTGCARSIYYGGQRRADDARREFRPAVSAARSGDVARSALQGRVPLRRDLPGRGVSGRAGPARSGRRSCCRSGIEHDPSAGNTARTSASSITGGCAITSRPPSGSRTPADIPGAPTWLAPLAATTLAEGGDRQSSRQLWTQLRDDDRRRMDPHQREPSAAAARRHGRDRRAQPRIAGASSARGRPAADWQELAADQRCAASRSIPPARRIVARSRDRTRRRWANASRLQPLPEGAMSIDRAPKP